LKLLRFAVGLICAVLLQTLGARYFSPFALAVDPFLILVVYHSLDGSPAWSSIGGSAAGLAQDALSGGPYGLHGFANTLVAFAASRIRQRLVIQQSSQVGLLFVLSAALQLAILASLQFLLVSGAEMPGPGSMAARLTSSGILGALLFVLAGQTRGWEQRRRARRQARLKL
jgi:rod shape-determining protein MreD